MRLMLSLAMLAGAATPALADRTVTDGERARLVPAISALGCSGGKMEWDESDRHFEIDDAVCADGKYDLKFSADYQLIKKERDD